MNLLSSKGEDEVSFVQYYAGAHQSCRWPNPIKIVWNVSKGSTLTTGTTSAQPPEVAVVNDTTMARIVELAVTLCPNPKS